LRVRGRRQQTQQATVGLPDQMSTLTDNAHDVFHLRIEVKAI
jgi:hypothetical protein